MNRFIMACVAFLAVIGALFGVRKSGEAQGRKNVEAKINEELLDDVKIAKEVGEDIDNLSDDELIARMLGDKKD